MILLQEYLDLLKPLLAFKSVSTDTGFSGEMEKTAAWLKDLLEGRGFAVELWRDEKINPVVYARYEVSAEAPTTLVYGHYDVQPAHKEDGWQSEPFELHRREKRLYGRGVVDNKGQVLIHIATVLKLIESDELAHNVIFLIEGNEETGSTELGTVLKRYRDKLACEHILVSDGAIPYRPTIEASLRGGCNLKIRYTTATNNLHSGIYGGGVPNAALELSRLVASFYDEQHRVTIPGFYDGVTPTAEQRATAHDLYMGDKRLKAVTGVKQPLTEPGYDFGAAVGLRPTLQVSGITGGYTGQGFANIIPATAEVRLNVRIVAPQDSVKVYELIAKTVKGRTPSYVDYEITLDMPNAPVYLAIDTPAVKHVRSLLEQAYGTEPALSYSGGSIPIVGELQGLLKVDPLLINLGNDDCNMHGVDENFEIGLLEKGLTFSELFFSQPPK